jgi:hypothetical protein
MRISRSSIGLTLIASAKAASDRHIWVVHFGCFVDCTFTFIGTSTLAMLRQHPVKRERPCAKRAFCVALSALRFRRCGFGVEGGSGERFASQVLITMHMHVYTYVQRRANCPNCERSTLARKVPMSSNVHTLENVRAIGGTPFLKTRRCQRPWAETSGEAIGRWCRRYFRIGRRDERRPRFCFHRRLRRREPPIPTSSSFFKL